MRPNRVVEHTQHRSLISFWQCGDGAEAFDIASQRRVDGGIVGNLAHGSDAKEFIGRDGQGLGEFHHHIRVGALDLAFIVRDHALTHAGSLSQADLRHAASNADAMDSFAES